MKPIFSTEDLIEAMQDTLEHDDACWEKLIAIEDLAPGDRIKIFWRPYDNEIPGYVDYGYLMALPDYTGDDWDLIVHVPHPVGGEDSGAEWLPLVRLLENEDVLKVQRIGKSVPNGEEQ